MLLRLRPPTRTAPTPAGQPTADRRMRRTIVHGLNRCLMALLGFAMVYLTMRVALGAEGDRLGSQGLVLAAAVAAACALHTSRGIVTDDALRRGWRLVAVGSAAWALGGIVRDQTELWAMIALGATYVVMMAALTAGALLVGHLVIRRDDWRIVSLDILPATITVLLTVWLTEVGAALASGDTATRFRVSVVVHGLVAAVAAVVGLVGFASRRRQADPATSSLMVGVALIALADLLWLQRWATEPRAMTTVSDTVVCIGLVMVALAALQARLPIVSPRPSIAVVTPRLTSQATPLSLMTLIGLCALQVSSGPLAPHGVEATLAAAAAVVLLAMTRDAITHHRERVLTAEIDQLSERVATLITQVGRDPLTGLLNHRSAHERLEHELATGRVNGGTVAVALIDVDNFKAVNDTLGHPMGDQVLQAVASVLTSACRAGDIAARYAGDEFMLVLPGVDEEHTGMVCSRILASVRQINHQLRLEGRVTVTLSVGVAVSYRCRRSAAQIVSIADAAMYDAKETGKDRFVVVDADTLKTATFWGYQPEAVTSHPTSRRAGERVARALTG